MYILIYMYINLLLMYIYMRPAGRSVGRSGGRGLHAEGAGGGLHPEGVGWCGGNLSRCIKKFACSPPQHARV